MRMLHKSSIQSYTICMQYLLQIELFSGLKENGYHEFLFCLLHLLLFRAFDSLCGFLQLVQDVRVQNTVIDSSGCNGPDEPVGC